MLYAKSITERDGKAPALLREYSAALSRESTAIAQEATPNPASAADLAAYRAFKAMPSAHIGRTAFALEHKDAIDRAAHTLSAKQREADARVAQRQLQTDRLVHEAKGDPAHAGSLQIMRDTTLAELSERQRQQTTSGDVGDLFRAAAARNAFGVALDAYRSEQLLADVHITPDEQKIFDEYKQLQSEGKLMKATNLRGQHAALFARVSKVYSRRAQ